jgi:hypothetical protein
MRPSTLHSVAERIRAGASWGDAFAGFLDEFYSCNGSERWEMLVQDPPLVGDARTDALFGAVAEYLAKQYRLGRVPTWCSRSERSLSEPWFTTDGGPGMQEYLAFSSPAEFRHRNIFTAADPLTRARTFAHVLERKKESDFGAP